jgi:DNA gyrase subunit A
MMAVKSGRAIRFHEEKVRSTGRGGIGVAGIEVEDENDEVVGLACINKDDKGKTLLVVSEKGFGKRTSLDDAETGEPNYRITNRGGKGVRTMNVTDKTGSLVGLLDVTEKEDLMITCVSGITIRMGVASISEQGRATQGVKLIRIDEGDAIAAITKLDEQEEEQEFADEADPNAETTNATNESNGTDENNGSENDAANSNTASENDEPVS